MAHKGLRGVATVEAVILLPVLLLLLVGVQFTAERAVRRHSAREEARACAFRYALHGCSSRSSACEHWVAATTSSSSAVDTGGIEHTLDSGSSALGGLSSIPILGSALGGLLGASSAVTVTGSEPAPAVVSPRGVAVISERVAFPCNEMPQTDTVASQVFDLLVKGKF
jgi:hypothetical protein